MSRWQMRIMAVLIGTFVVGPIILYASKIVSFGFGFIRNPLLVYYVKDILYEGATMGFVSSLVCASTLCQPRRSAVGSAVVALVIALGLFVSMDTKGLMGEWSWTIVGHRIVAVVATAVMGYLTAILTEAWQRSQPESESASPSFSVRSAEPPRYHL